MTEATNQTVVLLEKRLQRYFGRTDIGGLEIAFFGPMENGHAGHSYGLDLRDRDGALHRYILKLGPPVRRRSGSTDIFRQVPLLQALRHGGLPVPRVQWAASDEADLGAPFIVMERLPGKTYLIWDPDPALSKNTAEVPKLWIAGIRALAQVHLIDHRSSLSFWERPTSLNDEMHRWSSLIRHSESTAWHSTLHVLARTLEAAVPPEEPVGLIHGDFQPGNILYADSQVKGIVDWDLSAIGPQGIDVGWYLMMADANCWESDWRPHGPPPKIQIVEAYKQAGGPAFEHLDWYQAFAHFRLGAITGLNLKLHRSGKRIDPVWEKFAMTINRILAAAHSLVG